MYKLHGYIMYKNLLKILFFIAILLPISSCSKAERLDSEIDNTLNPSLAFEAFNLAYGAHPRQILDVYLPAGRSADTKTLLLLHGGGWSSGDKSSMTPIVGLIQKDLPHLAIVNMNYRLADANTSPFPMQIEDITAAVDFLKENNVLYNISENMGFIGTSAGAQLALLWCYAFNTDNQAKMVCSIVGPTNFTDPAYLENTSEDMQQLLATLGNNLSNEYLESVSPLHQVTTSAPPTILFYGGMDPLIPISQGLDLRDKLKQLEVEHEFTLYENAGHGWSGLELLDTWQKLRLFCEAHL